MSGNNSVDRDLLSLRVNGYCVLEGIIPQPQCDEIRERVLATVEREASSGAPKKIGFVPGLINHEQSFAPYLVDDHLLAVARAALGHNLRISFTSAIVNFTGNERGEWHADWPFNQKNAAHITAPYPDAVVHLTTLWMISPFREENGGTLVVPGSHRSQTNPTVGDLHELRSPFPGEMHVTGEAGSILLMDSRLWHTTAPSRVEQPRVALAVRYAPWWLNLEPLRPESFQRDQLIEETGQDSNIVPSLPRAVYEQLPEKVKPLYRHWIWEE